MNCAQVEAGQSDQPTIRAQEFELAIFDLDGVITKTAVVHATAWKRVFDGFLERRFGTGFEPFEISEDYAQFVDGRLRRDGVCTFLASRGIVLPEGNPEDPWDMDTIFGLSNAKNKFFLSALERQGVEVFEDAIELIGRLRAAGIAVAVVSASENCFHILESAGIIDLFKERVDGHDIHDLGLAGKPAPDTFIEVAKRVCVEVRRAVIFEDALAGVEAGRAGGFGLVVGVDRESRGETFLRHGADVSVTDLSMIDVESLPSAHDALVQIGTGLMPVRALVCLDYDGTLTPIVDRPENAILAPAMRQTIERLMKICTVAVVSGRDLGTIKKLVGLDIIYLADHGFEFAQPGEQPESMAPIVASVREIDVLEDEVSTRLSSIEGVLIERKQFTIAVHYRLVSEVGRRKVHDEVTSLLRAHPLLRVIEGKMVHEFVPNVPWDKGRAVLHLAERLGKRPDDIMYIGDDVTDEDVFRALGDRGWGIVVREQPRPTGARYSLKDPNEVHTFLSRLCDIWHRK